MKKILGSFQCSPLIPLVLNNEEAVHFAGILFISSWGSVRKKETLGKCWKCFRGRDSSLWVGDPAPEPGDLRLFAPEGRKDRGWLTASEQTLEGCSSRWLWKREIVLEFFVFAWKSKVEWLRKVK